jgi:hypothetical protein
MNLPQKWKKNEIQYRRIQTNVQFHKNVLIFIIIVRFFLEKFINDFVYVYFSIYTPKMQSFRKEAP